MIFPGWDDHFFFWVFRSFVFSLYISPHYIEWHLLVSIFDSVVVLLAPISGYVHMIAERILLSVPLCDLLYAQGINNIILLIILSPAQCLVHGESVWGIWCNEAEVGLLWCWVVQKARGGGVPYELPHSGLGKRAPSPVNEDVWNLLLGAQSHPNWLWAHINNRLVEDDFPRLLARSYQTSLDMRPPRGKQLLNSFKPLKDPGL